MRRLNLLPVLAIACAVAAGTIEPVVAGQIIVAVAANFTEAAAIEAKFGYVTPEGNRNLLLLNPNNSCDSRSHPMIIAPHPVGITARTNLP
jgi:hypothetical protein